MDVVKENYDEPIEHVQRFRSVRELEGEAVADAGAQTRRELGILRPASTHVDNHAEMKSFQCIFRELRIDAAVGTEEAAPASYSLSSSSNAALRSGITKQTSAHSTEPLLFQYPQLSDEDST